MDIFIFLFKQFRAERQQYQKQLREMLFDFLSGEAERTESKSKNQLKRVVYTVSGIIEDARLERLLTREEVQQLKVSLEEDLFKFMNGKGLVSVERRS